MNLSDTFDHPLKTPGAWLSADTNLEQITTPMGLLPALMSVSQSGGTVHNMLRYLPLTQLRDPVCKVARLI